MPKVTAAPATPNTVYYPIVFAPDSDPVWANNPGMLRDVTDLTPSKKNTLKCWACTDAQSLVPDVYSAAANGTPMYGQILRRVDGSARMVLGTTKCLLEHGGVSGWGNISKGGSYTLVGGDDWTFATFGNNLIAVTHSQLPQLTTGVGVACVDLPGSPPRASCITVQKNFVLLADCFDGTNAYGDQVWWSGAGNDQTWTPSLTTQAGNMRLRDTPGQIRTLVNIRDGVVAYKPDSIYLIQYTGRSPFFWEASLISDRVGCASRNGVAVVNGVHYFLHRTGVHRFDGSSVVNIGANVNRYLFDRMGHVSNYQTVQAIHDEYEGVILWFFHDQASVWSLERRYALVLNPETGRYGFVKRAWSEPSGLCNAVIRGSLSDLAAWIPAQGTHVCNTMLVGTDANNVNAGLMRIPVYGDNNGNGTGNAGIAETNGGSFITGSIGDDTALAALLEVRPRGLNWGTDTALFGVVTATPNLSIPTSDPFGSQQSYPLDYNHKHMRWDTRVVNRWFAIGANVSSWGEVAGVNLTIASAGTE